MSVTRLLVGMLCSGGGLGSGIWLTALCLLLPAPRLIAASYWPEAVIALLACLGGWNFPRAWWVIALVAGLPSLLFTSGWCYVIADEGQRNLAWPGLGALALAIALAASGLAAWRRLSRSPLPSPPPEP